MASEFHKWINAQSFIPGIINFNVARPDEVEPWFTMIVVSEEVEDGVFCYPSGVSTVELYAYGSERYGVYELLDQLKDDIKANGRLEMGVYNVWNLILTGVISDGEVDEDTQSYMLSVELHWERRS